MKSNRISLCLIEIKAQSQAGYQPLPTPSIYRKQMYQPRLHLAIRHDDSVLFVALSTCFHVQAQYSCIPTQTQHSCISVGSTQLYQCRFYAAISMQVVSKCILRNCINADSKQLHLRRLYECTQQSPQRLNVALSPEALCSCIIAGSMHLY